MTKEKRYAGNGRDMERKLARVMERLGVAEDAYTYDWTQSRGRCSCFVEMRYRGSAYWFENDTEKSRACGRNLSCASDLFAAVVYSLEGLARAVEQGIFTLDMLLTGVPALPVAVSLAQCFTALGFDRQPAAAEEVRERYRQLAKKAHPDTGGDKEEFLRLTEAYRACLAALEGTEGR